MVERALPWGATPSEWTQFSLVLGLTNDLLPVVSNPHAQIGEHSKLKKLGKTPSRYNSHGTVGGILNWTTQQSTDADIAAWSKQPDYGICVQSRRVRAIDVDVTDAALAVEIATLLAPFAMRVRSNSPKFLAMFELPGEYAKRVIKTKHGIIEFLANGQQFIAAGTHESGVRYEWLRVDHMAQFNAEQFELLWSELQKRFGIEPSTISSSSVSKQIKLSEAITNDQTAQWLVKNGYVLSSESDGRLHIQCPFADQHTSGEVESATSYFPANTGGFVQGHFKCLHAHCAERNDGAFITALGITLDDFQDISRADDISSGTARVDETNDSKRSADAPRYVFQPEQEFAQTGRTLRWLVKSLFPQADLGVIFGESGSGKSFFALDLAAHICLGLPYRNKKTQQGVVAYLAAEGANGFKKRLDAHAAQNEGRRIEGLYVLAAQPNFCKLDDTKHIITALCALDNKIALVIVDTFAQVTAGANENSGEDMGKALRNCRRITEATGAMVLLIHHSGKDATKGARGWSGLRAAADVEIEVTYVRGQHERVATITKLKDGDDNIELGFKLVGVNLGLDEDGEPITSCVVAPTGDGGVVPRAGPKVRLGEKEELVMRVLSTLEEFGGGDIKAEHLKKAVVEQSVCTNPARDTREQTAGRSINQLVEKNVLRFENGFVKRV